MDPLPKPQFLQGNLTYVSLAIAAICAITKAFGYEFPSAETMGVFQFLADNWETFGTLLALALAWYGRARASVREKALKRIANIAPLLLLCCLMTSCGADGYSGPGIQFNVGYKDASIGIRLYGKPEKPPTAEQVAVEILENVKGTPADKNPIVK